MPVIEATSDTIRLRILQTIVDTFKALLVDPDDLESNPVFSVVELGPLGDPDNRKRFTIGIVPQPERYTHSFPFLQRALAVAIEFRVTVNKGDPRPGVMYEQLLGVVEHTVLKNETWGGLAIKTELKNSDQDIASYDDKSVTGVLLTEVLYRHGTDDPYNPAPAYG